MNDREHPQCGRIASVTTGRTRRAFQNCSLKQVTGSLLTVLTVGATLASGCLHLKNRSPDSCCDAACTSSADAFGTHGDSFPQAPSTRPAPPPRPQQHPPEEPPQPPQEPPSFAPSRDKFLPPAQPPAPATQPGPVPGLPPGTEKPVPMPTTGAPADSGFRPASSSYFPPARFDQ